jgi:hypothetical protein
MRCDPRDRPFLGSRNRQPERPIVPWRKRAGSRRKKPTALQEFYHQIGCSQSEISGIIPLTNYAPALFHSFVSRSSSGAAKIRAIPDSWGVLYTMWMVFLPTRDARKLTLWNAVCAASWWNPSKNWICRLTPTIRLPTISSARSAGSCSGLDPRPRRSWNYRPAAHG